MKYLKNTKINFSICKNGQNAFTLVQWIEHYRKFGKYLILSNKYLKNLI